MCFLKCKDRESWFLNAIRTCYTLYVTDYAAVREMSLGVYGARYRLEICAAIQSGSEFTATELHSRLGASGDCPPVASVFSELSRLQGAGLLIRLPKSPSERSQPLRAAESILWASAQELFAEALRRVSESERA